LLDSLLQEIQIIQKFSAMMAKRSAVLLLVIS